MKHGFCCLFFLIGFLDGALLAQETAKIGRLEKEAPDSPLRIQLVRVQILLDRAQFRPGKIDGLGGEFTQRAADRYCIAGALPLGSLLDISKIESPYREYTVADEDKQWVGRQESTPAMQEKLDAMLYADLWESVAERFHCDLEFLKELNPNIEDINVGTVVRVPDVEEFKMSEVKALERQRILEAKEAKEAAASLAKQQETEEHAISGTKTTMTEPLQKAVSQRSLILLREERLIEVYENDQLIACFPCTPGSPRIPVVVGKWKVTANILLPYFRWDKSVLERGVRSDNAYNLPPGPNNPVGIVWIAINRPSIGMHGTPYPDQIGRNQSSGCIRLTNWDAFLLSQLVEKGTPLEVR